MAALTASIATSTAFAAKPRLARPPARLSVSCSASSGDNTTPSLSASIKTFSAALALSSVLLSSAATSPPPAAADIAGLTPCKESKAFAKREKQSVKKLNSSLKKYAPDSAPALAIQATIEKTKRRFENYGKFGLLCGSDGLPHLIGRSYLIAVSGEKKPAMREIIIDVELAARIIPRGFIWPVAAYRELINGDLVVDDADIGY
ncbi:unnamed protein product [Triticum turgidum subsp. durum]|uniref:Photosystem I reaction center subunit III n=1 Tax=Triticum turgidum subsp. durum TaxID=4567 RepID=A0A9R0WTT6_TRITD|nr:unnamed protein product [Triticum turgidum subsp. durum]